MNSTKRLHLSRLSLALIPAIYSLQVMAEEDIPSISVEGTELSDVSGEQIKSADLAEALTRNVPSISLIRRSGIANDIILRGQNKDNINITIDNAKIYIEGPYDIQNFGTLSGLVEIKTKQPEKELHGDVST